MGECTGERPEDRTADRPVDRSAEEWAKGPGQSAPTGPERPERSERSEWPGAAIGKYARVERERRFLLAGAPSPAAVTVARRITDRYVTGTRLRLRRMERLDTGECAYKLTQKLPAPPGAGAGAVQGLITNLYLSAEEHALLLTTLPGPDLVKTRLSVGPLGVDAFEGALRGLVLAEAEFESAEDAETFVPPPGCLAELTDDPRFTGGSLVRTEREQLRNWLAEYGLPLA
ncbi:hypothetical protein ACIQBJ_32870 [Kitasatospora sp. NPDC088391]|uniref:hypothetical protein n=1 Tax=Kitasatospora sp. NPDC088391 TaxID=3364074 RepID=UPI00382783F5